MSREREKVVWCAYFDDLYPITTQEKVYLAGCTAVCTYQKLQSDSAVGEILTDFERTSMRIFVRKERRNSALRRLMLQLINPCQC